MLTSAGTILFLVLFISVFVAVFRKTVNSLGLQSIYNESDRQIRYVLATLISVAIAVVPLFIISLIMSRSSATTDNYRTIYSNKIEATVTFKTSYDQVEFVGGKQLKDVTSNHSGVLTLSKDGVELNRNINHAYYVGRVEKGSVVEKIEYSCSVIESKLFGVTLMIEKSDRLKIHLKKPESETAKEKKKAETDKELRSLLESSK